MVMTTSKIISFLLLVLCFESSVRSTDARALLYSSSSSPFSSSHFRGSFRSLLSIPTSGAARRLAFLVEDPPLMLEYHNGPLLSATPDIPVYIVWYGAFSETQKAVVRDFFSSFSTDASGLPTVGSWWNLTRGYKDGAGQSLEATLQLKAELSDDYTKGKVLTNANLETLVLESLSTFPKDPHAIYLVLTADDVDVDDFCRNSCASHFSTAPTDATNGLQLPYAWVGNSGTQCPGMCAWPYAKAQYGPPDSKPLIAPNGDVGMDGMIINIGTILTGTVTNPFDNGFFQGDASAPLEASSACPGIYGEGAYSGYPGNLLKDAITGASYNVNGANDRKYLVPAIWDPLTRKCAPPS